VKNSLRHCGKLNLKGDEQVYSADFPNTNVFTLLNKYYWRFLVSFIMKIAPECAELMGLKCSQPDKENFEKKQAMVY
jgi:hypothetical protein